MNHVNDGFYFDWDGERVIRGNIEIKISGQEKTLLRLFVDGGDAVMAKCDLLDGVWGKRAPYVDELYLTQLIYRLRKSLRAVGLGAHIVTVPRTGYRFIPVPLAAASLNVQAHSALVEQDPRRARGIVGLLARLGLSGSVPIRASPSLPFASDALHIDAGSGSASYHGTTAKLTRLEQRLLAIFADQPDTVLLKQTLITEVWGDAASVDENCLTQLVSRLRRSLHPLELDDRVVVISKVGYRFHSLPPLDDDKVPGTPAPSDMPARRSLGLLPTTGGVIAALCVSAAVSTSTSSHAHADPLFRTTFDGRIFDTDR